MWLLQIKLEPCKFVEHEMKVIIVGVGKGWAFLSYM